MRNNFEVKYQVKKDEVVKSFNAERQRRRDFVFVVLGKVIRWLGV